MSFSVAVDPIDPAAVRRRVLTPASGAVVVFEGLVRNHNEGRAVERLEYEVYEPLAVKEAGVIIEEAGERWSIHEAACVHRTGLLGIADVAVVVAVSAAHRDEAYQASRYIIDQVKHRLPIWKKEYYTDGEAQWVNCQRCGHAPEHGTAVRKEPA